MKTASYLAAVAMLVIPVLAFSQNTAFLVEAESGVRGANMTSATAGGVTYITPSVNSAGTVPASAAHVVTYSVVFPAAGDYDLYVRLYVGTAGADDDSFFYGNGFGNMSVTDSASWVMVNGIYGATGYAAQDAIIINGGIENASVWKWIKLTRAEDVGPFVVDASSLTKTFVIAGREDGLLIDKFAFALKGLYFTVNQIENGLEGSTTVPVEYVPVGPEIAIGKDKFLGSCHSNNDQDKYFTTYWNAVIPGNGGKWGWVERTRNTMTWDDLDASYRAAKDNGYPFCMHVLVWGSQQPTWMRTLGASNQMIEIREWFQAVAERYPDIDYLQVVNEPIHAKPDGTKTDSGSYIDALGGTASDGTHPWIVKAFELAKEYFPDTPLMINEYNIIGSDSNTTEYLSMINELKDRGLIDIIGVQGHAFETKYYSVENMKRNLDRLAATGLPIMITEMDIDGDADALDSVSDAKQLAEMQRIFPMFWDHPSVMGIVMWGYRVGMWRSPTDAFLTDDYSYERPALKWMRQYVQSEPWLGYTVSYNWADTGGWLGGNVYVGYKPWLYSEGHWVWSPDALANDEGSWGFVFNPDGAGSSVVGGNWMGYEVSGGWADTGDWLGKVYTGYKPWVWTDVGWLYIDDTYLETNGAWAWMPVE